MIILLVICLIDDFKASVSSIEVESPKYINKFLIEYEEKNAGEIDRIYYKGSIINEMELGNKLHCYDYKVIEDFIKYIEKDNAIINVSKLKEKLKEKSKKYTVVAFIR